MSGNEPDTVPGADVRALLDADPHGCALARSVRADDGTIVDFALVYLNQAGSRFLGRPREELIGHTYRELWPETVTDGTLPLYRQVVQDREPMVRSKGVSNFPYRVVYFVQGDLLMIAAVAHAKRRPGYWRERVAST